MINHVLQWNDAKQAAGIAAADRRARAADASPQAGKAERRISGKMLKTAVMGATTLAIYFGLFVLEAPILKLTAHGGWACCIPIAIAFTVSYFHGGFTSGFWDALGVKAKK